MCEVLFLYFSYRQLSLLEEVTVAAVQQIDLLVVHERVLAGIPVAIVLA
jgi:hypothetical protein